MVDLLVDRLPVVSNVLLLGFLLLVFIYLNGRARAHLPPGPRGLPLLGNTLQIPTSHFGTYLKELHSVHGGFVYLNINGEHTFSIGDLSLATELLEKRSAIYASRPIPPYLNRYVDPTGDLWILGKPGANHYWGRKLSSNLMALVKAGQTEPLQTLEALSALKRLSEDEGRGWYDHINRLTASGTVAAMFGLRSEDDDLIKSVVQLVIAIVDMVAPSASIINLFPILDNIIPSAIPTPWRRRAVQWRKHDHDGWYSLLDEAVSGKGAGMSNWTHIFADDTLPGGDKRYLVTQFAAAAIETTSNALHSFVLACLAHPDWVEIAQQELDRVVGTDRLPTFQDRPFLPFIEAVQREVLRWTPALRGGVPHQNTADDMVEYNGVEYVIPKGSTVIFNTYAIEHDKNRYEDPEIFRPQRHLDDNNELRADYKTSVFGFGRRLCVGIPFAERSLFINIALILWAFNIHKATDPQTGLPVPCDLTDAAFDGGLLNGPLPFPAVFKARSQERVAIVRREWEEHEKDLAVLLPPMTRKD